MKNIIGIRVDIDFEIGITKGVPYLLNLFRQNAIKATFFVTIGPDGFKHNKTRLKSSGYLRRVLSFNPLKIIYRFGFPYMAKQFLGFSRNVGASHPGILKKIVAERHELGVHGYDHFWWAENIWNASMDLVREDMEKGLNVLKKITGYNSQVWASPNWRCSENSLRLVDEYDFLYGADCRGRSPFFPVINGWKGKKIQLPVTLPCLHETKQFLRTNDHDMIIKYLLSHLGDTFNVLCIHGYYEGILERKLFVNLVKELKRKGFKFIPMKGLLEQLDREKIPVCELTKKQLPGGRGKVSFQGKREKE